MRTAARVLPMLAVVAALAVGCSSGADQADTTRSPATPTTVPSTTVLSTNVLSTTVPLTTTVPPTTTSSSTTGPATTTTPVVPSVDGDPELAAVLAASVADARGGIVAHVLADGEGRSAAAGAADNAGASMAAGAQMRVGSITKTFIAAVVLQLVDEGVLALDERLDAHVDAPGIGGDRTIRSLLSHRSGLPDYTASSTFWSTSIAAPDEPMTYEQIVAFAEQEAPGVEDSFGYSNTNYFLLGRLIEVVDGGSVSASLERRIFDPLGLDDTFLAGDGGHPHRIAVSGFDARFGTTGTPDEPYAAYTSAAWTSGAMVSSMEDLTRFAGALIDGRVVSAESTSAMLDLAGGYGMGVHPISVSLLGLDSGLVGHGGAIVGFFAVFAIDPNSGTVAAVATNDTTVDVFTVAIDLVRAAGGSG